MKRLLAGIDNVSRVVGKGISFIMFPIVAIVCYEVVMRYVFHRPTIWASECMVYGCAFLYVWGAAWTMLDNRHVKIDMVYEKLSPRGQRILDIITFSFFALYMGMMLWVGMKYALGSIKLLETSGTPWDPPVYPVKSAFVIGVAMLILQGSAKFIRDIYFIIKGTEL